MEETQNGTLNNNTKKSVTISSSHQPTFSEFGGTVEPTTPSNTGKGDPFESDVHEVRSRFTGGTPKCRTVEARLHSTLEMAKREQKQYARRANLTAYALNCAMFIQIIVNAMVTGLSAVPNNRHTQIAVSALGAIGTVLASFIVRIRGTREPERSGSHAQNLDKFINELETFIYDEGHSTDPKWDWNIKEFRMEFDHLQTAVQQSENGQPMKAKPRSKLSDAQSPV